MPRQKLPFCDPDLQAPLELVQAVQQADVGTVRTLLAKDPGLVWADHLIHWGCRVPGYQGHGGVIAPEDAKSAERAAIIQIFLGHGADPSMRNKRKVTSLHMSSRFGLADVARALLEGGADPNATDQVRETPLYHAVNLGYLDVAKVLLAHGADPTIARPTRLSIAQRFGERRRSFLFCSSTVPALRRGTKRGGRPSNMHEIRKLGGIWESGGPSILIFGTSVTLLPAQLRKGSGK